jgi:hypothetical protein
LTETSARRSLVVGQAFDAAAAEQVHHTQVPITQHGHLVLETLQRTVDVFVGVDAQRLLEVVRQPEVVHHDAELLAVAGAVHARDRLQQLGLADRPVQVHHAFDRRVEAGEQHRLHNQESQRVGLGRLLVQ